MRSGEPRLSQGRGWMGAASPGSSLPALLVGWLRGRARAFWLPGTSAVATLGEFLRLCFGMVV